MFPRAMSCWEVDDLFCCRRRQISYRPPKHCFTARGPREPIIYLPPRQRNLQRPCRPIHCRLQVCVNAASVRSLSSKSSQKMLHCSMRFPARARRKMLRKSGRTHCRIRRARGRNGPPLAMNDFRSALQDVAGLCRSLLRCVAIRPAAQEGLTPAAPCGPCQK